MAVDRNREYQSNHSFTSIKEAVNSIGQDFEEQEWTNNVSDNEKEILQSASFEKLEKVRSQSLEGSFFVDYTFDRPNFKLLFRAEYDDKTRELEAVIIKPLAGTPEDSIVKIKLFSDGKVEQSIS